MNVSLTPELGRLADDMVRSGRYGSASEVVWEGLRLLEERDQWRERRLNPVRHKIKVGLEHLDRGEGIPGEKVLKSLKKKSVMAKRQSR